MSDDPYIEVGELLYHEEEEKYVASAWFTADDEANPLPEGLHRYNGVGGTLEEAMIDLEEGIEEYDIRERTDEIIEEMREEDD